MSEAIISVRQLHKTFRVGDVDVEALPGVDLEIQSGEFVALIGPSGSGKSTLFHILGGLTPPTRGTVRIAGHDLAKMNDAERTRMRRSLVSFVFQKFNLLPTLTAGDNIRLARYLGGNTAGEDARFRQLLETLGLSLRLEHKPAQLSGGEQQRVAIARAVVNRPAILLADEPTGNLDSANSENVLRILRDLNRELGQTIVMITHNAEAAAYAHHTLQMRDGRLAPAYCADGTLSS